MKKTMFLIPVLLLSSLLFLHNAFAEFGLPEGAKVRFGKGYKTGSSIFSDDGTRFAVSSSIGLWLYDVFTAQEVALLSNHPREFTVLAASPDGDMLASANENAISLWEIHTGRRIARLTEHFEDITSLVFSPDGKVLASASEDNTVRLWDATTGRLLFLPQSGHAGDVISIAFSPDSKMLASGSRDNSVRLWSVTTGQPLATLEEQIAWGVVTHEGHTGDVTAVAFSPDGTTLASGGADNKIRLWDVATKEHQAALSGHSERVTALAFSPDGTMLASGSTDDTIRLWNPTTERHFDTLDSDNLDAYTDELWNLIIERRVSTIEKRLDVITLAFSFDGSTLVSGHAVNYTQTWELRSSATRRRLSPTSNYTQSWDVNTVAHLSIRLLGSALSKAAVRAIAFSPDGGTLASGHGEIETKEIESQTGFGGYCPGRYSYQWQDYASYSGHVSLWNTLTNEHRTILSSNKAFEISSSKNDWSPVVVLWDGGYVHALAFSPDNTILASGSTKGFLFENYCGVLDLFAGYEYFLRLWSADTGEHINTHQGHNNPISSVAFSPNSRILATGSRDDTIRLWNPATGQYLTTLRGHRNDVNTVAFSPDGETLASGSRDDTIKLWNPNGQVRATLYGHGETVRSVAFSPDGKILASGGDDNTVRLWNPATVDHITTLEGHTSWVRSVAFSPDGGTLASGSDDRTIRLWDSATGQHLATLSGHRGYVYSIAFSPDGETLASGSGDGTILLWEIEPAVSQNPSDVNGDGVVNVLDLVAVASKFGQTGQDPADVNGDGVVNISDIVLVAGAMGAAPAAPSISPQILEILTVTDVQKWLTDANQLKFRDTMRQRGITVLEQLLEMLIQAEAIPTETALLPNYPNPFNPETWIPYQLAEAADVTMTLYAADGRLVRTLGLGYQPAGVYHGRTRAAYWDGRNALGEPVASGVYFYTLTAGEFTATRKMLIMK